MPFFLRVWVLFICLWLVCMCTVAVYANVNWKVKYFINKNYWFRLDHVQTISTVIEACTCCVHCLFVRLCFGFCIVCESIKFNWKPWENINVRYCTAARKTFEKMDFFQGELEFFSEVKNLPIKWLTDRYWLCYELNENLVFLISGQNSVDSKFQARTLPKLRPLVDVKKIDGFQWHQSWTSKFKVIHNSIATIEI